MKNIALILASGTGERCGLNQPKQFYTIGGKTLLEHSVEAFDRHDEIDRIVVVAHPDFLDKTTELTRKYGKVLKVVAGGSTRQESSYNGVFAIDDAENVLIHDAARAFVSEKVISACVDGLKEHEAVCAAIECTDTILEVDENGKIVAVPQRKFLRCAQTPQCFRFDLIKNAHKFACENNIKVTDDCGLVLAGNLGDIFVVAGSFKNKKITHADDIDFVKWLNKNN